MGFPKQGGSSLSEQHHGKDTGRESVSSENESTHVTGSSPRSLSKPFWRYYIDDYIKGLSGKDNDQCRETIFLNLTFVFKGSDKVSDTHGMRGDLTLVNTKQLREILDHYGTMSGTVLPKALSYFEALSDEISYRNRIQHRIDEKLSRMIITKGFLFSTGLDKDDTNGYPVLNLKYSKLDESDLHFALSHMELMLLVFKTWNHHVKDNLDIDLFMVSVRERFLTMHKDQGIGKDSKESFVPKSTVSSLGKSRLPGYFWEYYVNDYIESLSEVSLDVSRIPVVVKIRFTLKDAKDGPYTYNLNNHLLLRDTDRIGSVFKHYSLVVDEFKHPMMLDYIAYGDLSWEVMKRSRIQDSIDRMMASEVLGKIPAENFGSYEGKDGDRKVFRLNYDDMDSSKLGALKRHLELMVTVFKNWNDDARDREEVDRFLGLVGNVFQSINARALRTGKAGLTSLSKGNPLVAALPESSSEEDDDDDGFDGTEDDHRYDSLFKPFVTGKVDYQGIPRYLENRDPNVRTVPSIDSLPISPILPPNNVDVNPSNPNAVNVPSLLSLYNEDISMMEEID